MSLFEFRQVVIAIALGLAVAACTTDSAVQKQRHLQNGDKFVAEKNYAKAILEFRNALRLDERFGEARHHLAKAYALAEDRQRALAEFVRAADLLPNDADVQLDAVRALLNDGQFQDARTRAEGVIKADPRNADAHVLRASATAGLRDYAGAISFIEDAIDLNPGQSSQFVTLATLQAATGQQQEAEASFKQAVAMNPSSAGIQVALANYYWVMGRVSDAEEWAKKAVALDPSSLVANQALANLYRSTGRADEAEAPLKRVAELSGEPRSRLVLADYYLSRRREADARSVLEELIKSGKAVTVARVRLAQMDYAAGNVDGAHAIVDDILRQHPKNAAVMVVKALWLLAEQKSDAALVQAQAAVAADPNLADAQQALGAVQVALNNFEAASLAYTEVLRIAPSNSAAQIALVDLNLALRRPQSALDYAEQAARNAPLSGRARLALSAALLANGQTDLAERHLQLVVNAAPKLGVAQTLMGQIQFRRKDFAGARRSYEQALELNKSDLEALAGLVALDVNAKNLPAAERRVEEYLSGGHSTTPALLLAARTHVTAGNLQRAESILKTAIEKDSSAADAYRTLGQVYIRENRLDEARREYERIARERPGDVAAHTMVGMILQVQGNMEEARKVYERAVGIGPQAAFAANNLAFMHAEEGRNLDRALNLAQSAKAALPNDPDVSDTLGWVYYKRGLAKMAVEAFQQSVVSDPKNATYQYHLGLALMKVGDQAKGKAALEAALKLEPDAALAGQAKQALAAM